MPVTFDAFPDEGYFRSMYSGEVTGAQLYHAYESYYQPPTWLPLTKELVDLGSAKLNRVTAHDLKRLARFIDAVLTERGISEFYTAVFAPNDLPFGLSRMYEMWTEASPEAVMVFRNLDESLAWLETR